MSRIWRELKEAQRAKSSAEADDGPKLSREAPREQEREAKSRSHSIAVDDRRNTRRRNYQFLLLVYGSDAEKQPFHEEIETLDIAEDGCSFALEIVVARGQRLFLANKVNQAELAARVVHVGRRTNGKTRVGVEFLRSTPEFWLTD